MRTIRIFSAPITMGMILSALLATLMGCVSLYLGSTNQTLLAHAWPKGLARIGGLLGLGLGLAGFVATMQVLAGSFSFIIVIMLALAVLPYLGAWRSLGIPEADRRRRRA